jgi:hypothetical protein
VLAVTLYTDTVVPDELSFRIFQDMRGVQATYRITDNSTTELTVTLGDYDDTIYVNNASELPVPDLTVNLWGIVMIGGERIMYRYINIENNTLSSLLRGTGGTAKAGHFPGDKVYDLTADNLLMVEYQDRFVTYNEIADGQQQEFVTDISVETIDNAAVLVFVGGIASTDYILTANSPVTVFFNPAPIAGYQVTVQVRRGLSWYEPGESTASDGIALQETNTQAARFLRGF